IRMWVLYILCPGSCLTRHMCYSQGFSEQQRLHSLVLRPVGVLLFVFVQQQPLWVQGLLWGPFLGSSFVDGLQPGIECKWGWTLPRTVGFSVLRFRGLGGGYR